MPRQCSDLLILWDPYEGCKTKVSRKSNGILSRAGRRLSVRYFSKGRSVTFVPTSLIFLSRVCSHTIENSSHKSLTVVIHIYIYRCVGADRCFAVTGANARDNIRRERICIVNSVYRFPFKRTSYIYKSNVHTNMYSLMERLEVSPLNFRNVDLKKKKVWTHLDTL